MPDGNGTTIRCGWSCCLASAQWSCRQCQAARALCFAAWIDLQPATQVDRLPGSRALGDRFRFGRFELRCVERQLLRDGDPVRLGARAMDLLLVLVAHRDRMVTKGELLDLVWPGLVVEEANVQVQVSALRRALGASAVATIPGLGYRLSLAIDDDAAQVSVAPPAEAFEGSDSRPDPLPGLPAILEPLIGRDDDLPTLTRLIGGYRLVTITGAGGIGKTRLAQSACRELASRCPDGVWWVDLAALGSAARIVPAVAKAANVSLGKGKGLPELVRALSGRRLLLVLDNCEHLVAPLAEAVRAVLAGTEHVSILATSQQPLRLKGEHVYKGRGSLGSWHDSCGRRSGGAAGPRKGARHRGESAAEGAASEESTSHERLTQRQNTARQPRAGAKGTGRGG